METIPSEEIIERAGGATEAQKHGAQKMIDRMTQKYSDFKISLNDVLVMHVVHGLTFEHIEQTLTGMM